jgi:hypothetical protein
MTERPDLPEAYFADRDRRLAEKAKPQMGEVLLQLTYDLPPLIAGLKELNARADQIDAAEALYDAVVVALLHLGGGAQKARP